MSLSQALVSAMSGLKVNQQSLALVAANVANADTPGYIRKTVNQVAIAGNNTGIGVRVSAIQRELDTYVQRQLRIENSGATYASTRADFYNRLQTIYGTPGSNNALDTIYNNFTTALQALSTSPDDTAARSSVISTGQALAQQLNYMTDSIQGLRKDAELGISDATSRANEAMSQIAKLNTQIAASGADDTSTASLLDQRDAYIDQLSKIMDINVLPIDHNQVAVFTNSGVQLVGTQAAQLSFDAQGTMNASAQWTSDPSTRSVGTLTLKSPYGGETDLIASGAIRSGEIASYLEMRDKVLPEAQNQIDAIAASMASSLSDKTTSGTAVTSGLQNGYDIDIGSLAAGNNITINYTDSLTNTPHTITLTRVNDPSVLPLSNDTTANPNDKVYGIDFSGGFSTVLGQIQQAIGSTSMVASNPSGTTLRILDDGPGNIVKVNSVSTTTTATSLTGGSAELPFFTDGNNPYTGAISGLGSQSVGFAGRISVNSALVADPSKLVTYASGVSSGDGTRPDFLLKQLTQASVQFSPSTGLGTADTPFTGSITTFLRQVISSQGQAASSAQNLKEGQDVVLSSLQQRFNDTSSVNVDQEMANLLTLQNSYAANARVMSAVKDMLDSLMKI
ncbi:flagellar hook-associated protein FlgK [Microbacteriaceae bacterium K1510]|nr:flagellar hook-associated protein FlgK [Microbacteriaceae bacterium K1510]